jgi:hypothetical protein
VKSLTFLRGKLARFLALLALVAGLASAAAPGLAVAAAGPMRMHAAQTAAGIDCDHGTGHVPIHRLPAADCCVAGPCALTLALPAFPSGLALPAFSETGRYALRALRQPPGIVTAPIPHPPKPVA